MNGLERIVKLLVPVAASFTMACCGTMDSRDSIPPPPEPIIIADADAEGEQISDAGIGDAESQTDAEADEDLPFYDEDGCPRVSKEPGIERDDYLLNLYKFNPYYSHYKTVDEGKLVAKVTRELACFDLEDFPENIVRHHKRYARKGHRVPTFAQMAEKRALKVALQTARTVEERVEEPEPAALPVIPPHAPPAKAPVKAAGATFEVTYDDDSWTIKGRYYKTIRGFIQDHKSARCFTVTGYAVDGEAKKRVSTERAKGVAEHIKNYPGITAKTNPPRYKGTGLGRKAVIRAGCD